MFGSWRMVWKRSTSQRCCHLLSWSFCYFATPIADAIEALISAFPICTSMHVLAVCQQCSSWRAPAIALQHANAAAHQWQVYSRRNRGVDWSAFVDSGTTTNAEGRFQLMLLLHFNLHITFIRILGVITCIGGVFYYHQVSRTGA